MSELLTKTAKLLPYAKRGKALPSFATAYNYEPEPGEGLELGNLFVVIEVLTANKQAEEVADMIIKTAGESYYNQSEEQAESEAFPRFEAAIKAVNHQLAEYTNQGNASWVGRLSAVIAVQSGDQLHITQTGSSSGYLYRKHSASHITEDMASRGPHRPISTFTSIASGQLEVQDHLLLATPALFHQVNRDDLLSIISDSTPQEAVRKLSELVNQNNNADRVAALVVEVTTPELLALQRGVESDEPDEVKVGQPESVLEVAKVAAAPVVNRGLSQAKRLGQTALNHSRASLWPATKSTLLKLVQGLRQLLRNPRHRDKLWFAGGALILLIGWLTYTSVNAGAQKKLVARYDQDYTQIARAKTQLSSGDKAAARQNLVAAKSDLGSLAALPQSKLINNQLSHRTRPEDDPGSIAQLSAEASGLIDQIDGLITVSATEVADFSSLRGVKPGFLEVVANKAVIVDGANSSIYVYDPATPNQIRTAVSTPAGIGKPVATTASAAGDGVFILTDEPAVWFYKLDGDALTKQTVSSGDWPKGKAIASYLSNLYILSDDSSHIYKHVKALGGYTGKSEYVNDGSLAGSTALTVDGNVYTAGSYGLKRITAGKVDKTVLLPDNLLKPFAIQSIADGNSLVLVDQDSRRIGLIDTSGTTPVFSKQITINGNPKLIDAKGDTKTKLIYVLSEGKLLKFPLP